MMGDTMDKRFKIDGSIYRFILIRKQPLIFIQTETKVKTKTNQVI